MVYNDYMKKYEVQRRLKKTYDFFRWKYINNKNLLCVGVALMIYGFGYYNGARWLSDEYYHIKDRCRTQVENTRAKVDIREVSEKLTARPRIDVICLFEQNE